jgi:carbon starvation protein
VIYVFIATVVPAWLLLTPRDYLSMFMKVGTILVLAIAVIGVRPETAIPALTNFASSTNGPIFAGSLFPFLFITIACGALSGYHTTVSAGTTPKLIQKESQTRMIGYGGMLMESFVGIMALIAASIIQPGIYFAMNTPLAALNPEGLQDIAYAAAATVSNWGFVITPDALTSLASDVGEQSIISRAGGAPTLAVGMALIIHQLFESMGSSMAFWYHFAILFEALFILTAVDAGTRSARFMLQDLLGLINPNLKKTNSLSANLLATSLVVAAWGYFLYVGVVDPLGGINTLWPLFGISNQMLAAIALMLCTVVLFKMKQHKYAWVPIFPMAWLLICTMVAGWQKVFISDPAISFFAKANQLSAQLENFTPNAVFKSVEQLEQVIFNNRLDGVLTIVFMLVVIALGVFTIKSCLEGWRNAKPSSKEIPYEPMPKNADEILRGTVHK